MGAIPKIVFFLCFLFTLTSAGILRECELDVDCGSGYHCFESHCERCFPCEELFNRYSPFSESNEIVCARDQRDCEECLPGYKLDDSIDQRPSMKCYAIENSQGFAWMGLLWIVLFIILTLMLVFIYFKCYHIRSSLLNKENNEDVEVRLMMSSAPPPYSPTIGGFDEIDYLIGTTESSRQMIFRVEEEHTNRAVPIISLDPVAEFNFEVNQPEPISEEEADDSNSISGSSETIPSLWEPTASIQNASSSSNLVRSLSLEMPQWHSRNELVRLPSDPSVSSTRKRLSSCGESYSHRHVRLSQYRSESQSINFSVSSSSVDQTLNSKLTDQSDQDEREPDVPEPFSVRLTGDENWATLNNQDNRLPTPTRAIHRLLIPLSEPHSGQGSQDSGFHQESSRRRPRNSEEVLENRSILSTKRRRRSWSEN